MSKWNKALLILAEKTICFLFKILGDRAKESINFFLYFLMRNFKQTLRSAQPTSAYPTSEG